MNDIVKLALDTYKGVATAYAEGNPNEVIRNALIEANNGNTKLDYKAMRDGKCNGLYSLVEELITKVIVEGLPETSPVFQFVDYKNMALGDKPEFYIPDNSLLTVSTIADGTQAIRRQRIMGGKTVTITPEIKAIKIYEELSLILSGRIDWIEFVNRVGKSFVVAMNNDIANAVNGLYNNVSAPYAVTGSFTEQKLLELVEHVEAATNMPAKILGTRSALRKITIEKAGNEVKEDYYNFGYSGKFNGVPCFRLINGHKNGTTDWILNDSDIYVVAGEDKFIKCVNEGETTIIDGDPTNNQDLTQEYTVINKNAIAIALSAEMGVYRIA